MQITIDDKLGTSLKHRANKLGGSLDAVASDLLNFALESGHEEPEISFEEAKRGILELRKQTKPLDIRAARDEGRM